MHDKINVAILGASGYTGAELIRLLLTHPYVTIAALTGDSSAGKNINEVFPHLPGQHLPKLTALDVVDYSGIDVVFCCLPHAATQAVVAKLPAHLRIIDLSADFRLTNPDTYAQWYGHAHQAIELQKEAVYGLTEHYRQGIKQAHLVANPGCYPTSASLPLIPLLKAKAIAAEGIIIDAKSGITGAGRSAKQGNLFAEINDGISAYGIAAHRHTPEIEQNLSGAFGEPVHITFTPHLMPMNRGILSTIYVKTAPMYNAQSLRDILIKTYGNEPFVRLLPEGQIPATHHVRGTNHCLINVFDDRIPGQAIIVSVIDNLVKGASGQAVQNMNIMVGYPEVTGLQHTAIFP